MATGEKYLIDVDWERLRGVIFDVGGVLLRTVDYAPRHDWDKRLGLPPGTVEYQVFNSPQGTAAQMGAISTDQHWDNIRDYFGLTVAERERLRQDFWAGDQFDDALARWIRTLREDYRLGIISNAFDDLRQVLHQEFKIAPYFDVITISAEEKMMKPDAEIYLKTLRELGLAPQACVFIDDNFDNIQGARRLGLGVIHYHQDLDLPGLWAARRR